jgi:hypothetical protein
MNRATNAGTAQGVGIAEHGLMRTIGRYGIEYKTKTLEGVSKTSESSPIGCSFSCTSPCSPTPSGYYIRACTACPVIHIVGLKAENIMRKQLVAIHGGVDC